MRMTLWSGCLKSSHLVCPVAAMPQHDASTSTSHIHFNHSPLHVPSKAEKRCYCRGPFSIKKPMWSLFLFARFFWLPCQPRSVSIDVELCGNRESEQGPWVLRVPIIGPVLTALAAPLLIWFFNKVIWPWGLCMAPYMASYNPL